MLNALVSKPLPIYGDGSNFCEWLYVEDLGDALLRLLQQGAVGRSYNIGGEGDCSNLDLVHMICAIFDQKHSRTHGLCADLVTFVTDRPGHDGRDTIDPTRIRDELGWRPLVMLEEGAARRVDSFVANEGWCRALQDRAGVGQRPRDTV